MIHDFGKKFPHPEIHLRESWRIKLQGQAEVEFNGVKDTDRFLDAMERSHKILLIKSFREIEGKFIDFVSVKTGKKVVPAGPLVQDVSSDDDRDEDKEIMEWLDQKEKSSVVYVSFGSEYFLTKEERDAISKGLELSNVSFIWVVRFPLAEEISIEEALPEGFLDRIGKRGKVVEGWAPQARILKHSSTGAFVSHCGMSSLMESMKWGVPIIAMPMHLDQPLNARVVEAAGFGIEAVRDEKGNLQSEEIAKVIRKVLVDESGEEVRKKAKEFSEKLEMKGDEEIDIPKEELTGLC